MSQPKIQSSQIVGGGGGQSLVEDLSLSAPIASPGNIDLVALPTWANKITILIADLQWTTQNFVAYLYMGPGITQGGGLSFSGTNPDTDFYDGGNGNKIRISQGYGGATVMGWYSGRVVLTRIPGTFQWIIDINLAEVANQGVGSSNGTYITAAGVHLGTAELTQVTLGNFTGVDQGTVNVLYEE